jgi:hypothetical protein
MPATLTPEKRIEMLTAIAEDESIKVTQRLRALEEIGKIEARLAQAAGAAVEDENGRNDAAADPMADLDEMEAERVKRVRRKAS